MGTGVGLGNANNANVLNAQMINYDNYLELEYYMYSENVGLQHEKYETNIDGKLPIKLMQNVY